MRQTISIIGAGAFGRFMLRHLTPYFHVKIFDPYTDISEITQLYTVTPCKNVTSAAQADIIILAVPVSAIEHTCVELAPHLKEGQLVMDVASVKVKPQEIMLNALPDNVDLIGLHPLFGPQSGKYSIHDQNVAVVNIRGQRSEEIIAFLTQQLHLNVISCTADQHDQQMAYVQGLTHMIARVFQRMDIPEIKQETKTFSLLQDMLNIVKNDSDELFKAIQTDNPYVEETKEKFFTAVKQLEDSLKN